MKAFMAVTLLLAIAGLSAQQSSERTLDVYFIDAEGGHATLYVSPSGQSMLVDTGYGGFDGRDARRILAAARDAGVKQIDYLVITHYHGDHVGGVSELAKQIPIRTFVDHGPTSESGDRAAPYQTYLDTRRNGAHLPVRAGDRIPVAGVTVHVLASAGGLLSVPLESGGIPNPRCADFTPMKDETSDDAHSVGTLVTHGSFRLINLGDLSWNQEYGLVCPTNRIGTVDVLLASQHGDDEAGNPEIKVYQNVRLSEPVENITWHPENYQEVIDLRGLDRALTNTALVTILVVLGQLATSIFGGYAFARLKFPGRDTLFVFYLGTIMIPFVMLIVPLYQLMVAIGWTDRLVALIVPWIFTAYGTFLMRQHFITFPKEIEEAALIDGASRFRILKDIIIPASVPALATQATFTFLYAWNSFLWPLVVINVGNEKNHVLTLALNVLRGRASDTPNLILAGAAIAIIPPLIVFILGQRFFVESVASSGVKG